jgi:hypothetical protein
VTDLELTKKLLSSRFPTAHVNAAVRHYQDLVGEYQKQNWEITIAKGGKFIEATLKTLWVHVGQLLPPPRKFKADTVINELPKHTADAVVSLLIPRACRFAYDVASNRDGRHDTDEINANEMDATAMLSVCSWVLGELIRHSLGGGTATEIEQARRLVASLTQKRFPMMEEIDGRLYFNLNKMSAREVGLLILWAAHPQRVSATEVRNGILRHHFSSKNADVAIGRLRILVDNDGQDNLRLRAPGIQEAELLMQAASAQKSATRKSRR